MIMFFSERKKLSEEYEKWVSENKDVLDCPLTVISWLVAEGYVGKTKVADLEAKLAELREQITILDEENSKTFMKSVNAWRENAELKQQLAEKDHTIETLIEDSKASKEFLKKQLVEQPKQIVEKIREKIVDYNIKYSSAVDVLNCLDLMLNNLLKEMK